MPIYEFYCPDCHTIFSFLTPASGSDARPACPKCRRPNLDRRPSTFAVVRGGGGAEGPEDGDSPFPGVDEERLEGAMESVMNELGDDGDEDPRQMARLLRRFGSAAGMEPGPKMEEILRRLEAGEDPDRLEEELEGGAGEGEENLEDFFQARRARRGPRGRPKVDTELYFL